MKETAADGEAALQVLVEEFLSFCQEHASPRFREEEEALLPFFVRYGDLNTHPIRQMQREHILIAAAWRLCELQVLVARHNEARANPQPRSR